MADLAVKKKERNYVLDVLKLIAAILVIMFHFSNRIYSGAELYILNEGAGSYFFSEANLGPFKNVMSMAFYTYTSGYWLMQRIHKEKAARLIGRGKDTAMLGKYFISNFANYWPYLCFGILWGFVGIFIAHPTLLQNPLNIFMGLQNSVFHLLGIHSAGILGHNEQLFLHSCADFAELTNGYTDITHVFIDYNVPMWYLSAMIVFAPILYIVFMKSELAGIVTSIVIFTCGNAWFSVANANTVDPASLLFLGRCAMRLLVPMMLGIWGYYLAEYLKNAQLSNKARNIITGIGVFGVIWFVFMMIYGGGYIMMDYANFIILTVLLSGQGKISPVLNKFLAKVPGIKNFAYIGLGFYVLHMPLICIFRFRVLDDVFMAKDQMVVFGIFMAALVAIYIPFYFIDKYVLRKISKGLMKFFKANEPPVFDEVKSAVAEAK